MTEQKTAQFPKVTAAKLLSNSLLQLTFDNGQTRQLHTHFIGEVGVPMKRRFFGLFAGNAKSTSVKLQPDGGLMLGSMDYYSPEELWKNSEVVQPQFTTGRTQRSAALEGVQIMEATYQNQTVKAWQIAKTETQPDWIQAAFEQKKIWWAEKIEIDFEHNVSVSFLTDREKTVYRVSKKGNTLVAAGEPETYGQLGQYLIDLDGKLVAVSADQVSVTTDRNAVTADGTQKAGKIDWEAIDYAVWDGKLVRFWHVTPETPERPDWLGDLAVDKNQVAILLEDGTVSLLSEKQAVQEIQPIAPIEAAVMQRPKTRQAKLLKVQYGFDTAKAWQISLDEEPVGWLKHAFDVRAINWNRMPGGKLPYLEARGFYTGIPLGIEGAYLILNADNYLLVSQKEFDKTYKVLGEEA